jgi:hypothetical protein
MERSAMRGGLSCGTTAPDFAALHPGYETTVAARHSRSTNLRNQTL